jgi:hypothetical protein
MLTRELLKLFDWTESHLAEPALAAAEALARSGLTRDAVLVWLDQVYNEPQRYLADPVLAPLARARMEREPWALECPSELCCCAS